MAIKTSIIFKYVDCALKWCFVPEGLINREIRFHLNRKQVQAGRQYIDGQDGQNLELQDDKSIIESILHDMGIIDSKSSALLTHTSIVIAVLAILCSLGKDNEVDKTYGGELLAYIFFAMLCLRCLNIMGPPSMDYYNSTRDYREALAQEVLLRRAIYQSCLKWIFRLTFIVLVTVAYKLAFAT